MAEGCGGDLAFGGGAIAYLGARVSCGVAHSINLPGDGMVEALARFSSRRWCGRLDASRSGGGVSVAHTAIGGASAETTK